MTIFESVNQAVSEIGSGLKMWYFDTAAATKKIFTPVNQTAVAGVQEVQKNLWSGVLSSIQPTLIILAIIAVVYFGGVFLLKKAAR